MIFDRKKVVLSDMAKSGFFLFIWTSSHKYLALDSYETWQETKLERIWNWI